MIVCDESEQGVMEISGVIGWSKENKLKSTREATDEDIRRATEAELQSWLDRAFDVVNKKVADEDRVVRILWVSTRRSTGKAKARFCVLGLVKKPNLTKIPRDSTTLPPKVVALILQFMASNKWKLVHGDIKGAFLSGDEEHRDIFVPLPEGVRDIWNISQW